MSSRLGSKAKVQSPWHYGSLSDLCDTFTDGDWIEKKDQAENGIRLIQTGNVGVGAFKDRRDKARFISQETFQRLNCTEVLPGDLLVSRLPDPVGRSCRVPECGESMITAVDCSIVRTDQTKLDSRFLLYFTQSREYLRAIDERCTGTTRRRISRKNLGKVSVPTPPLNEQKRIVAVLDQAFAALELAKEKIEANLEGAERMFRRAAENVFREISVTATFTLPVSKLAKDRKGAIRTGPFGSQLKHGEFVDAGIRVLGIDNAVKNTFQWGKPRFITPEKYAQLSRYRVFPGDVIITIMGTCGRCAIIPPDIPKAINTKHLCCITLDQEMCLPEYLHRYFLLSPKALDYLASQTKGTVMDGLNMGIIKELPVDLPGTGTDSQREVCRKIDELEARTSALIDSYTARLGDIADFRQALLEKAFSGQLN